ncbi:hypothetical protein BXZ70DRAFT_904660 [Cristinia sonorae]|uniref:Uncharacterized protein n=1 Tax=Cristinia sonorae TaxID=1940300 RepID=A0A8K0XTQ8_9AGAR|nr:hypothetical protein BXZ70DRAFT_904660 [Cristinia sonorae]
MSGPSLGILRSAGLSPPTPEVPLHLFMDFTNINDPAGVQALLDRLRSSQAWQSIAPPPTATNSNASIPSVNPESPPTASATTVAALLSQLTAPADNAPSTADTASSSVSAFGSSSLPATDLPYPAPAHVQPPIMKEQRDLERRLFDERRDIQRAQQEKVKMAVTKAKMVGSGVTQYEANSMTESFKRQLEKFDLERALSAWDGLVSKQQAELEGLGVPSMFVTTLTTDRETQQKVVRVLTGIAS